MIIFDKLGNNLDSVINETDMNALAKKYDIENAYKEVLTTGAIAYIADIFKDSIKEIRDYKIMDDKDLAKIIKDFVDKSISTGRKIKCGDNTSCSTDIESIKQGGTYWLDAGKLDSPECYLEGNKLYRICDYPSGFEEYILVSDENNFYVIKDDSQKNKTYWVDVMYVNQVGAGRQHDVFFDISITEGDYTKWKEYESRENEKKLMWKKMTKRQKRKFSKLLKNGEVEEQENDAMPEVNVVGRAVELMGN